MKTKMVLLAGLYLEMSTMGLAGAKTPVAPDRAEQVSGQAAPGSGATQRPRPCHQTRALERTLWPNGSLLWGMRPSDEDSDLSTVLASVDLNGVRHEGVPMERLKIQGGHLVVPRRRGGATGGAGGLVGAELQGVASDGQRVAVSICAVEPAAEDQQMTWYRIEIWNEISREWENPCVATAEVRAPRVLAVQGVWDAEGERREVAGRFTFACETGAIAKCIGLGYKPWQEKGGHSLTDYHQACTRMVRADYCGDGRSFTQRGMVIDAYDTVGVQVPEVRPVEGWDPALASFEAAWTLDGAYCLAQTRRGEALQIVRDECPGHWMEADEDLGGGDRCVMRRKEASRSQVLMRNRSYGKGQEKSMASTGGGR